MSERAQPKVVYNKEYIIVTEEVHKNLLDNYNIEFPSLCEVINCRSTRFILHANIVINGVTLITLGPQVPRSIKSKYTLSDNVNYYTKEINKIIKERDGK